MYVVCNSRNSQEFFNVSIYMVNVVNKLIQFRLSTFHIEFKTMKATMPTL